MKVKFVCHTGLAGASHEDIVEYDEGDWEGMSEEERERELVEWANNFLDMHYEEIEDE